MKIYLVQYIIILKPAKGDVEPPLYKMDIYKSQEKDKWDIQKVINYEDIDGHKWYKIKWIGYNKITQELEGNLKNIKKKVKKYYKKVGQVIKKRKD